MPHPFDLLVTVLIRPDLHPDLTRCPVSMPRDIIPEAVMQREPAKLALTMRLAFWSAATRSAVAEHLSKVYEVESMELFPEAEHIEGPKCLCPACIASPIAKLNEAHGELWRLRSEVRELRLDRAELRRRVEAIRVLLDESDTDDSRPVVAAIADLHMLVETIDELRSPEEERRP